MLELFHVLIVGIIFAFVCLGCQDSSYNYYLKVKTSENNFWQSSKYHVGLVFFQLLGLLPAVTLTNYALKLLKFQGSSIWVSRTLLILFIASSMLLGFFIHLGKKKAYSSS